MRRDWLSLTLVQTEASGLVQAEASGLVQAEASGLVQTEVSEDSFVEAESSVLRINNWGKNPAHRKSANRYFLKTKQGMITTSKKLKLTSYIYLLLVPIIAAGLGFGVGNVSYKVYLPVWLLNATLMVLASWSLGLNVIRQKNENQSKLAMAAFFLIIPWILISMFAGLGPPPEKSTEWTETAKEQQVRYFILVISGVLIAFGIVTLRDSLKAKGENFYSLLSLTAILIAIPLFIINMLYWGFYLTELFKIQTINNTTNFPDWFLPVRQLFGLISVTEVALTYFATFAVAMAMRKVGWLNKTSSFFYILFSLLAFTLIVLSALLPETFNVPGFAVSIPASPFLMPYFIGVNLLRQVGNKTNYPDENNSSQGLKRNGS